MRRRSRSTTRGLSPWSRLREETKTAVKDANAAIAAPEITTTTERVAIVIARAVETNNSSSKSSSPLMARRVTVLRARDAAGTETDVEDKVAPMVRKISRTIPRLAATRTTSSTTAVEVPPATPTTTRVAVPATREKTDAWVAEVVAATTVTAIVVESAAVIKETTTPTASSPASRGKEADVRAVASTVTDRTTETTEAKAITSRDVSATREIEITIGAVVRGIVTAVKAVAAEVVVMATLATTLMLVVPKVETKTPPSELKFTLQPNRERKHHD